MTGVSRPLPTNADGGPFPIDVGLELDTESRRSETLQVLAALPEWSHKELENAAGASMKDLVLIRPRGMIHDRSKIRGRDAGD